MFFSNVKRESGLTGYHGEIVVVIALVIVARALKPVPPDGRGTNPTTGHGHGSSHPTC